MCSHNFFSLYNFAKYPTKCRLINIYLKCLESEGFFKLWSIWICIVRYLRYVSYTPCTKRLKVILYKSFSVPAFWLWSHAVRYVIFHLWHIIGTQKVSISAALQVLELGMLGLWIISDMECRWARCEMFLVSIL